MICAGQVNDAKPAKGLATIFPGEAGSAQCCRLWAMVQIAKEGGKKKASEERMVNYSSVEKGTTIGGRGEVEMKGGG